MKLNKRVGVFPGEGVDIKKVIERWVWFDAPHKQCGQSMPDKSERITKPPEQAEFNQRWLMFWIYFIPLNISLQYKKKTLV